MGTGIEGFLYSKPLNSIAQFSRENSLFLLIINPEPARIPLTPSIAETLMK